MTKTGNPRGHPVNTFPAGYESLRKAIVVNAARDYRLACKRLKRKPGDIEAARLKSDVERFFLSAWCVFLTDVEGEYILKKLQEEEP